MRKFVFIHQKVIAVLLPLGISCKDHFSLNSSTCILDDISFVHPVSLSDEHSACFADDILSKCPFNDFDSIYSFRRG